MYPWIWIRPRGPLSLQELKQFYPRDAMLARYYLWLRLSVCLSQADIVSKLLKGSSSFWHTGFPRLIYTELEENSGISTNEGTPL